MASLKPVQVAAAAYMGGFRGTQIAEAVAVAKGESAYNPIAPRNSSCNCRGLWQINLDAHKQYSTPSILAPANNAAAAFKIYGGDWCGGRTSSGKCQKFEAYGKSDANGTWSSKMAEGNKAYADMTRLMQSGKTPEQILGSTLSLLDGPTDSVGAIVDAAGDLLGNNPVTSTADAIAAAVGIANKGAAWISSPDNWIRVGYVIGGGLLIGMGLSLAFKGQLETVGKTALKVASTVK